MQMSETQIYKQFNLYFKKQEVEDFYLDLSMFPAPNCLSQIDKATTKAQTSPHLHKFDLHATAYMHDTGK